MTIGYFPIIPFSKRAKTKVHKIKWTFNIRLGMDSLMTKDVSYQHLQANFPLQCNRNTETTIIYAIQCRILLNISIKSQD